VTPDLLDFHIKRAHQLRVEAWRESGWTGYDPKAKPFTFEEIEKNRTRYTTRV